MDRELKQYKPLWQEVINHKAKYHCQIRVSGCTGNAFNGAHHIIPRWITSARFKIDNGIACCPNCHNWAEANPNDFEDWLATDLCLYHRIVEMKRDQSVWRLQDAMVDVRKLKEYRRQFIDVEADDNA